MIVLHHREQPGWHRVTWLLEELRVAYRIQKYSKNDLTQGIGGSADQDAKAQQEAAQASSSVYSVVADAVASSLAGALPPKHTPTISDGPVMIRESGAIVEYLIMRYGKGQFSPKSEDAKRDDMFFSHFAEGSFMPPLVLKLVFNTILEKSPFFVRPFTQMVANQIGGSFIDPVLRNNFSLVDYHLKKDGGRTFLAGGKEPTGGDFMMSFPIERAVCSGAVKDEEIPATMKEYLARLQARSAYQAASARLDAETKQ